MDPTLSRRAGQVMSAPVIRQLNDADRLDYVNAIAQASSFDNLDLKCKMLLTTAEKQVRQQLRQAESERSGGQAQVKKAVRFIGYKGSSRSGNRGHAGRPGIVGGSAPKANDNIAQARFTDINEMPTMQRDWHGASIYKDDQDQIAKSLMHDQGFDGLPDVVSQEDLDKYVEAGETEIFRGLYASNFIAQRWADEFRHGELFVGQGTYGSGTYASIREDTAQMYAGRSTKGFENRGAVLRMTIKPSAKIIEASRLADMIKTAKDQNAEAMNKTISELADRKSAGQINDKEYLSLNRDALNRRLQLDEVMAGDPGRLATILGYDAIQARSDGAYYVILNRTAVRVQATDRELPIFGD